METFDLSTELKQLISTDQAWHYSIIPANEQHGVISFWYSEESNLSNELENELLVLIGKEIVLKPKSNAWITNQLSRHYPRDEREQKDGPIMELKGGSHTDLLSRMIEESARIKGSDIHLEAYEERCRVRFRIDGKLVERYVIGRNDYPALINKIKIKSNLDISEKRLPQDGRIIFSENGRKFDIRVSVLPTLYGEKIVLRLLNRDATEIDLNHLGFHKKQLHDYLEGIKKPNGIVLISGPTGSGKTTTLYATLKLINRIETNILTIEDPIEYTLEGINQVQLKENIGLDFASALRTFLRQDPDVIMVGEIRDAETARMAVRAALTGHLVLSTVHTNSAWGTVTRLIDMGVPAYLVASTLNLSVAQRLLRCLCPDCRKEELFDSSLFPTGYKPPVEVKMHYVPTGCSKCYFTGYKGRRALYEVIPIDAELKERIRHETFNVSDYLKEMHIPKLSDMAFDAFFSGETSIHEVYPLLSH